MGRCHSLPNCRFATLREGAGAFLFEEGGTRKRDGRSFTLITLKKEDVMSLKYSGDNICLAKQLRKNSTPQEKHLWYDFLSKYEVRFQRQKAIDNYIVDFYCHKAKLVIEIDGSQHFSEDGEEYDLYRTEQLEKYGLTIIRFTNDDINKRFSEVCDYIDVIVKNILDEQR